LTGVEPPKGVGEKYFPRVGNYSKPRVLKERVVRATGLHSARPLTDFQKPPFIWGGFLIY